MARRAHPDDTLLDLGLIQAYKGTIENLDRFGDQQVEGLIHQLVGIMIFSTSDRSGLLDAFTAAAQPSTRSRLIDEVAWTLGKSEAEVANAQWERWMRAYWNRRLGGIPLALHRTEYTSLVRWVRVAGTAHGVDAAELATRQLAGLPEHSQPSELLGDELTRDQPESAGRLLAHLLSTFDV